MQTIALHGGSTYTVYGPWQIPVKQDNVLCPDGKSRTVFYNGRQPDTFFTQPGRITCRGTTITGFVSWDDEAERYTFTPTGKHREFFTALTSA